jgi:transposase-like protein
LTAPHLILEVRLGPRRGTKAALRPGQALSVGRTDASDLAVPEDAKLSPRHFLLRWDGQGARVEDLGSAAGTQINGETCAAAEVRHGGWIRAGETDFTVMVEGHTPAPPEEDIEDDAGDDHETPEEHAPPPFPAVPPAPKQAAPDVIAAWRQARKRVLAVHAVEVHMARRERVHREEAAARALPILEAVARTGALHAVLDAARSDRILQVLREAVEEHRSLYEGVKGIALEDVAPYLVRLPADSRLLAQLVREGWMRRWGIFLEGHVPARELRRHLRRFLMIEAENGEPLYFRYYDPACLRDFWPTCSKRQLTELCGPLGAFLVEGERGEVLRLTEDGRVLPVEAAS